MLFLLTNAGISLAQGCDDITIATKSRHKYGGNSTMYAKVVEITKKEIKLRKCKNGAVTDETVYVIPKADIIGIYYANGKIDKFDFKDGKKQNNGLVRKRSEFTE